MNTGLFKQTNTLHVSLFCFKQHLFETSYNFINIYVCLDVEWKCSRASINKPRAWCKTIVTTSFYIRTYDSFAPSPRNSHAINTVNYLFRERISMLITNFPGWISMGSTQRSWKRCQPREQQQTSTLPTTAQSQVSLTFQIICWPLTFLLI